MADTTRPTNPYAFAYKNFLEQTTDHQLVVLQDSGLYRHLRVQAPGTRMWSWDITTWPGHLATSGDIADGHVFSREPDMLGFFADAGRSKDGYYSDGAPSISVSYWAEKLCGSRSHEVKKYDPDSFIQQVREHLEESEELGHEAQTEHDKIIEVARRVCAREGVAYETYLLNIALKTAVKDRRLTSRSAGLGILEPIAREYDITLTPAIRAALQYEQTFDAMEIRADDSDELEYFGLMIPSVSPAERRQEIIDDAGYHADSEYEAHTWLQDNEDSVGSDTFEWELREYDLHFLFTCYAIALTTKLWDEHVAANGTADTYVLVDGGLVQNNPALPVFDLDVLDSDNQDEASAAEALGLRERILAHPQARTDLTDVVDRATGYVQTYGSQDSIRVLDAALAKEQAARDLRARRDAERAARIAKQRADQEERNREHAARAEAANNG